MKVIPKLTEKGVDHSSGKISFDLMVRKSRASAENMADWLSLCRYGGSYKDSVMVTVFLLSWPLDHWKSNLLLLLF